MAETSSAKTITGRRPSPLPTIKDHTGLISTMEAGTSATSTSPILCVQSGLSTSGTKWSGFSNSTILPGDDQ